MAKQYGGVSQDSEDKGKAAYKALLAGGSSGFNAVLGGGRSEDGQYARVEAHGFYWTASESDAANGLFYNFGRGARLSFCRFHSLVLPLATWHDKVHSCAKFAPTCVASRTFAA
jgi:hypothetical protein